MLPERLKSLRKEANLTQKEVAEKLGFDQKSYSFWENGKRNPKNVQQIADFFNVSTDYLLGNTDIKSKNLETDLNKTLDTVKSFDGKPMYDEDRDKIREFLRKRMEDRLKDN